MPTTTRKILVATSFLLGCLSFNFSFSAEIPTGKAEDVGMSSERLLRINTAMKRHIDAGDIQGAVTIVARRGKLVHFETHGLMDVDADRPMQEDSLFIMMSSTKPLLGVATYDDDRRRIDSTRRSSLKIHTRICRHAGSGSQGFNR